MWIKHLFSLIGSALSFLLQSVGTTLLGLLLPLCIGVAASAFRLHLSMPGRGKKGALANLKQTFWQEKKVVIFLTACSYSLIFLYAITRTVYLDHMNLLASIAKIRKSDEAYRKMADGSQVAETDRYNSLRSQCDQIRGMNDALGEQNRDQQSSINNCQNQAIARLTPPPLKVQVFHIVDVPHLTGGQEILMLTTNRLIQPVRVKVDCQRDITEIEVTPLNGIGGTLMGTKPVLPGKSFNISFDSPALSPDVPMALELRYLGSGQNVCTGTPI